MTPSTSTMQRNLDSALDSAVSEGRLVGGAVAVCQEGELVYTRAVGSADRESAIPFKPNTIVRFASVTKLFVSVVALRLIDQEVIRLNDPVTKWLPGFRPSLPDGREAIILIRHLLTHTSGLGYRSFQPVGSPYDIADVSDGLDLPGRSLEDNLGRIAAQPLLAAPGGVFMYSLSTDVLGGVLQSATSQSLPELVRSMVTDPCGIRDTGFTVGDVERLATPYILDSPEARRLVDGDIVTDPDSEAPVRIRFVPSRVFDPSSYPSGGAGMVGTADGVMTLLEALRLDARDGANRLLSMETAQSLFRNGIGDIAYEPGKAFSYCGEVVTDPDLAGTPQSVGTLSWGGAYGHSWFVDPVREFSVVIVTNTIPEGLFGQLPIDVRDAVYRS